MKHYCDPGLLRGVSKPGWGGGGSAEAEVGRGQEEWKRHRQRGKDRFSERPQGGETTSERDFLRAEVPMDGVGGGCRVGWGGGSAARLEAVMIIAS